MSIDYNQALHALLEHNAYIEYKDNGSHYGLEFCIYSRQAEGNYRRDAEDHGICSKHPWKMQA